jgi:hypothetical protein
MIILGTGHELETIEWRFSATDRENVLVCSYSGTVYGGDEYSMDENGIYITSIKTPALASSGTLLFPANLVEGQEWKSVLMEEPLTMHVVGGTDSLMGTKGDYLVIRCWKSNCEEDWWYKRGEGPVFLVRRFVNEKRKTTAQYVAASPGFLRTIVN